MSWENLLKRRFTVTSYTNTKEFLVINEFSTNEIVVEWGYGDEDYPDNGPVIREFKDKDINYAKEWLKNWLNKKGYSNMLVVISDKTTRKTKERLP